MSGPITIICVLAGLSWLAAGLWLEERLWPRFARPVQEARALNAWLQAWQLNHGQGKPLGLINEVPQFKFFGTLAANALTRPSLRQFSREILWEWREGINKEIQFEQKWQGLRHGGWAQFGIFTLITWIFVALVTDTLTTPLVNELLMAIGAMQVFGFVLYWPLMRWLAARRLAGVPQLMECLYTLRSLSGAGLSGQQVVQAAKAFELPQVVHPQLKSVILRTSEMVRLYQQQGVPLAKETVLLLQEVWFMREELLSQVVKLADQVRLGILLICFGGSYFLFLIGLIQQLLSQS